MIPRILHVVTDMRRGGLETMLMNYYRQIDRTKLQFDFLTHREYDGDYGEEIRLLGGIIYHLPKLNPFSGSYKRVLGIFFDEHPEYQIIHVHQDCLSSVILKVAKKRGVRVRIAHSHADSQDKNLKYIVKLYFRRQIPYYATDLMACSKNAGNWMFRGAPFKILSNAIDAGRYAYNSKTRKKIRKEFEIGDHEIVVGHVGRFSLPKNHDFLIDVFNEFQKRQKSRLLLVGEGVLKTKIEQKAMAFGLTDKVVFAGVRSDVPDILQAMDVFVFPSIYEGFGIAILEAQAAGLPCVMSAQIPDDAIVTDLTTRVDLSRPVSVWAEKMMHCLNIERRNCCAEIKAAGFDIHENVKWLQEYYLQAVPGDREL